jgi:Gpi18-like mannosyltransferase
MGTFSFRQQAAYTVLLFMLLMLVVPRAGHPGDLDYWLRWAKYTFEHGLGNVYQLPDNNYNPLYHYILWLYGRMMGNVDKMDYYRAWLKGFSLLFDFAGAFWAASLVPERSRRFGLVLLLLFNIGYLYNSLIWVQVDTIYTFFAFGAVVLAVQQRAVGSMLSFVLAFAAKTQAIIFLPPLLLLWLPLWYYRPLRLVQAVGASALLVVLILAPFIWWAWESYLPRIIDINFKATQVYPFLSLNAYNFWFWFSPSEAPALVPDSLPFAGLTYHLWGLILFCSFSAIALLPLLVAVVRTLLTRPTPLAARVPKLDMALVLLCCGTVPLLFAFFNTQMHERYWHAAILFMAAYGFLRHDYLPYVLVSAAYFLNLEAILRFLQLMNYGVLLFQPWFVAALFGLTILLAIFKIYRLASWRKAPIPTSAGSAPALALDSAS